MTATVDARSDLYAFAMQGKEHSPAISDRASEKIDAFRAAELLEAAKVLERKFGVTPATVELRLMSAKAQQSSGHDVAAKLVEDNPDLDELLNATEATT